MSSSFGQTSLGRPSASRWRFPRCGETAADRAAERRMAVARIRRVPSSGTDDSGDGLVPPIPRCERRGMTDTAHPTGPDMGATFYHGTRADLNSRRPARGRPGQQLPGRADVVDLFLRRTGVGDLGLRAGRAGRGASASISSRRPATGSTTPTSPTRNSPATRRAAIAAGRRCASSARSKAGNRTRPRCCRR